MSHRNDQCARLLRTDPAYAFAVLGLLDLAGPWLGWRLRGRWLVAPDGCKTNPAELAALLYFNRVRQVGLRPEQRGA